MLLIKTNPSIFQLLFKAKTAVLMQTFRRTELVVFLLTQRDNLGFKTDIARSDSLEVRLANGKLKKIYFDKGEMGTKVDAN